MLFSRPVLDDYQQKALQFLQDGQLQRACEWIHDQHIELPRRELRHLLKTRRLDMLRCQRSAEDYLARRAGQRLYALGSVIDNAFNMDEVMPAVDLLEGYSGKFMLLRIMVGAGKPRLIIRSGEAWHREIVANTNDELHNAGFDQVALEQLGGDWVQANKPNLKLWGSSDDYGMCDKHQAGAIMQTAFPGYSCTVK